MYYANDVKIEVHILGREEQGSMDYSQDTLNQLHQKLDLHFDEEELRTLCFSLQVEYETLPAQGKGNKARELIHYLARRDRIPELMVKLQENRPSIGWNAMDSGYIDPKTTPEFVEIKFPSPPFAYLTTISGPAAGKWIFLTEQTRRIIVGRHKDTDVAIPDTRLAGRHFAIIVKPEDDPHHNQRRYRVEIMDIASTNGTFVNGRLIQERWPLQNDDTIQAGGSTFRFGLF